LRDAVGWLANHLIGDGDMTGAAAALDRAMAASADAPRTVRLDQLLGRCQIAFWSGDIGQGRRFATEAVALSRPMGPHLRTHATTWVSLAEFSGGVWPAVIDLADQTARLIRSNAGSQFCAAAAATIMRGAIAHALAGRADEARALMRVGDTISIGRATLDVYRALPQALLGTREIPLPEHPADTIRANRLVAATILGRWDIAREEIARMRELGIKDAPFPRALADAVEEESRAATAGGPAPTHSGLKELGYFGWSEMLARARVPLASAAPSSS
jgi:hypothetical protein